MKHAGGRPTVMTEKTLEKLKEAFLNDATDEQACLEADISAATLYNYQIDHPEFLEKKELWKEDVKYRAKINIAKSIKDGNVQVSQWLLPLRERQNYSARQEVVGKDGESLLPSTFANPKIAEAVKEYEDKLVELISHESKELVETEEANE